MLATPVRGQTLEALCPKDSATVLNKFAEASDRIQFSINASSIASNGATSPGGRARTCGFKAALPRERLNFCAILSNVAVRSYDGALRSSMVVVGGVEASSRHLRRRDGARHT